MAIKALATMVRTFPAPVYCYHEIVHNQEVVRRFEEQGVVFVDSIEEVPQGSPIMLSAHGSAPEVVADAETTGSFTVNSVCPLVTKVHHEVRVRVGAAIEVHTQRRGVQPTHPTRTNTHVNVERRHAPTQSDTGGRWYALTDTGRHRRTQSQS